LTIGTMINGLTVVSLHETMFNTYRYSVGFCLKDWCILA
jgi:hypothetical protein